MKNVKIFPLNQHHFEEVTNLIIPEYEKDPFNFLFIGPSGFYVKQVADLVAKKLGRTINRDAFRVINQYITELLINNEPDSVVLERDFLKVYIKKEIEDLIEKEKKDSEFSSYLKIISKSQKSTDYILDIFEKEWEITRLQNTESLKYSENFEEFHNSFDEDSNLYKLYKNLQGSLEDILNNKFDDSVTTEKNYDPTSVYKWFVENYHIEKKGKKLIISGFFDLTPLTSNVLNKLFDMFETVDFYIFQKLNDRSFFSLNGVYNYLLDNEFEVSTKADKLKEAFDNKVFNIIKMSDNMDEIQKIAGMIKKYLINEDFSPEDIGVVIPDDSYGAIFADYFEEIRVPYRFKQDIPLSDSQIVNILLQPLKTVVRGYEVEDLLAMVETGFGGDSPLTMEQIEGYLRHLNLIYSSGKSSLNARKKEWMKEIEIFEKELKINLNKSDEKERIEKQIDEIDKLKTLFLNLFDILKDVLKNRKSFTVSSYRKLLEKWFKEDILKMKRLEEYLDNMYENKMIHSEINALKSFESMLLKTEKSLEKMLRKEKNIKIEKFYKIISELTQIETYRNSERYSNTVEIMNLSDSRFVYKKKKFFTGFTEDNYPKISNNPFLNSITNESGNIMRLAEKGFRRNLIISMIFSDEIIMTNPVATLSGQQILASPYEKEFIKLFNITPEKMYKNRREIIKQNPDEIFSYNEAILYYVLNKIEISDETFKKAKLDIETISKHKENNQWISNEKTYVNYLSHNRTSTYVDCPFKYYLSNIAKVSGEKDFTIFAEGNLKHKIMEKLFTKYPDYSKMKELDLETEKLKQEIKTIAHEVWDDTVYDEISRFEAVKTVEIEKIAEELLTAIQSHLEEYIKIRKNMELNYSQVVKTEEVLQEKLDFIKHKDLNFNTRIDRIDLLNGNYEYRLDEFDDIMSGNAYSIIDYKNKYNIQSEQLFLYYLTLKQNEEWKNKLEKSSIYLKFMPLSETKTKVGDKFIKIQNETVILKKPGNSKQYVNFHISEFYKWMDKLLDHIENSYFVPIAKKERKVRRFIEEMKDIYECRDTGEKYYDCDFCDFRNLCTTLEYLDDFKVKPKSFYR
ncbi:MAG: PD-(D/E)XK nuclease family protein [Thermotogota bacterium]